MRELSREHLHSTPGASGPQVMPKRSDIGSQLRAGHVEASLATVTSVRAALHALQ